MDPLFNSKLAYGALLRGEYNCLLEERACKDIVWDLTVQEVMKSKNSATISTLTLANNESEIAYPEEGTVLDTNNVTRSNRFRSIAAFWLFGLCNNFAYVIMLSAAHDILHSSEDDATSNEPVSGNSTNSSYENGNTTTDKSESESDILVCNTIGTGAILLADILPTLLLKMTFPFFLQKIPYNIKILLTAFFGAASYVIVAFSSDLWLSVIGVVCASIGAGLGEITFLSLTTFYHIDVISGWSSGTGGAGVLGSTVYAGFTSLGLTPRTTLLIQLVIPALMLIMYFFVLPPAAYDVKKKEGDADTNAVNQLTYKQKFHMLPKLVKYMLPLSTVYFAEYFINQGLHELLYFNGEFLTMKEQYRWYQVDYQVGVFISRSSVNFVKIKKLWILPILQLANMALLMCQIYFRFIPNFWIIIAIVFWEGLLGGGAYVNTFYRMTKELSSDVKEFCIGVATVGDSMGIAIAGSVAIPFHNYICGLNLKI